MSCTMKETSRGYFVIYPAPESRKLDLFGYYAQKSNVSTNFISENLFLAKFHYRDVYQSWFKPGYLKQEDHYWTVLD